MNYELSKKLKDAGWTKETYWFYGSDETDIPCLTFKYNTLDTCNGKITDKGFEKFVLCYAPTLEELIDACPKTRGGNEKTYKDYFSLSHQDTWYAEYLEEIPYEGSFPNVSCGGSTPEEAVANLWLALNEKK